MAILEKLLQTSQGKAVLADMKAAYTAYRPEIQKVLDFAVKDDNKAADDLLQGPALAEPTNRLLAAIDRLVALKSERLAAVVKESEGDQRAANLSVLTALIAALVVGLGVAFTLSRSIANGVHAVQITLNSLTDRCASGLVEGLNALAHSDLTVKVTPVTPPIPSYSGDEIGETARVTNLMRDKLVTIIGGYEEARAGLQSMIGQVQEAATTVAETSSELGQAANQTSGVVQHVTLAVQHVAQGSEETSVAAQGSNEAVGQLGQVIDGIARGATDQAHQIQSVSNTASQMAADVEEVASTAQTVAAASQQARASAEQGARAVRETVVGMQEIKAVVTEAAGKVEELGRLGERSARWWRPSTTSRSRPTCWP